MYFHATDAAALALPKSLIGCVGTRHGYSEENIRIAAWEGCIHTSAIVELLQGSVTVLEPGSSRSQINVCLSNGVATVCATYILSHASWRWWWGEVIVLTDSTSSLFCQMHWYTKSKDWIFSLFFNSPFGLFGFDWFALIVVCFYMWMYKRVN